MAENCLIVIDLQNDFLDRLEANTRASLIANTNQLIETFRERHCPVIWIRQLLSPDLNDAPLLIKDRQIAVVIDGTPGAEIDAELDRRDDDHVVTKKRYSAFFGTNLGQTLRDLDPERITLAGVNTHACVRSTAIDAYQRDMRVLLASDCLASYDPTHGRISMAYMDGNIARAMSNHQIRNVMRGDA